MKKLFKYLSAGIFTLMISEVQSQPGADTNIVYQEMYRPQLHFSPKQHWMNDPNGMVFYKGIYHLFFQYYPDGTVWGPMHWGHATSKDLVHWNEGPIAIYPDSIGLIFSGSAVVDSLNTSGLGKNGKMPLVAIYAQHDIEAERGGKSDTFQTQGIAYSLDEGKSWTKYEGNPVLRNPGIRDFRDPKVMWYAPAKKWIMTLATKDRITFYSSKNLKEWTKESDFGATVGAHGGVWECPDLFPLTYQGKTIWILLVSINPGGPNKGSATQYFTGSFDGKTFTPMQTDIRWVDWGADNYAGVTWSNTGKRKIFLGWMSNWQYAQQVPTTKWRSAMTVPRDLSLQKVGAKYYLVSTPVAEQFANTGKPVMLTNVNAANYDFTDKIGKLSGPAYFKMSTANLQSFALTISNTINEKIIFGYDKGKNEYYIDRTHSGKSEFEKGFAAKHIAPRISMAAGSEISIMLDVASIEVFADGGLTNMTDIFFPNQPYTNVQIQSPDKFLIQSLQYRKLKSIWK